MAGMNAIHCKFEHDKCRNSKKYPQSGQNLYIHCSSKPNNDFVALINNATDSWFNEYQICDMSFIDKYHDTDLYVYFSPEEKKRFDFDISVFFF